MRPKSKWQKLKLLIPTAVFFASPWVHKFAFDNLKAAIPDIDPGVNHFVAILGAFVTFAVTAMWAVDL